MVVREAGFRGGSADWVRWTYSAKGGRKRQIVCLLRNFAVMQSPTALFKMAELNLATDATLSKKYENRGYEQGGKH